jgi:hypothetical protein
VDQRDGVLLSLTRGDIIDPELAVSYALELGEHNPDYMRSVLLNVPRKSYLQLAHNYVPTCQERYGVTRLAPACKADKGAARSQSISELVADELQTGNAAPLGLLADEQQVRSQLPRLTGLFEPYLDALYEKRQNQELEKFEASSTGARLVAALLLAADRSGEQVQSEERGERDRFRAVRRAWLEGYLLGRSCDPDCKGRIADLLVTNSGGAGGAFDHALAQLLERPEPELTSTIGRLHARLLWCQVDPAVVEELRDKVIVPAIVAGFKAKPAGDERLDDLIGLMALVPEPRAGTPERAAWDGMLEAARKQPERLQRCFYSRRSTAERQRKNPSQALKAGDFCIAGGVADTAPAEE